MKMELGTKIDYLGNVYEYIGIYECTENGKMIFQSVVLPQMLNFSFSLPF